MKQLRHGMLAQQAEYRPAEGRVDQTGLVRILAEAADVIVHWAALKSARSVQPSHLLIALVQID